MYLLCSPLFLQWLPPLRPPLLSLITQFRRWPFWLSSLDGPHLRILRAVRKEIHPMLNTILNLLLGIPAFLLFQLLQRSATVLTVDLRIVFRKVHQFDAAQIRRNVFSEAASYEGASAICASEACVGTAGAVETTSIRDIVDRTVDREVERKSRVCAVIFLQFYGCKL